MSRAKGKSTPSALVSQPSPSQTPIPLSDIATSSHQQQQQQQQQLDPHLLSLAARVQAHHASVQAKARARQQQQQQQQQYQPSLPHLDVSVAPLDPADHAETEAQLQTQAPVDPILYEIEQVVNEIRRGKVRHTPITTTIDIPPTPSTNDIDASDVMQQTHTHIPQHHHQLIPPSLPHPASNGDQLSIGDAENIQLDDEIDPTLREIVNSLTNAQQVSHVGPGLSHAQAAAAIGAHLTDAEERERLQHSLQSTLEDLTQASFGSFFPGNFAPSPSQTFLDLNHDPDADLSHDTSAQAEPSTSLLPDPADAAASTPLPPLPDTVPESDLVTSMATATAASPTTSTNNKRGRGRPKGSKNKHKVEKPPRPPKPPPPPKKPKGRPPKVRSEADQADHELRLQERSMGIKRQKGRPRKFPGYLVREMRLKKNRAEFNVLLREFEESKADQSQNGNGEEGSQRGDENVMDVDLSMDLEEGMRGMMSELGQGAFDDTSHDTHDAHGAQVPHAHQADHDIIHHHHHHQNELDSQSQSLEEYHHGHEDEHAQATEEDFTNWSVHVQDSQTLLEAVGVGVGVDHHNHDHDHDQDIEIDAAVELLRGHGHDVDVFGLTR